MGAFFCSLNNRKDLRMENDKFEYIIELIEQMEEEQSSEYDGWGIIEFEDGGFEEYDVFGYSTCLYDY